MRSSVSGDLTDTISVTGTEIANILNKVTIDIQPSHLEMYLTDLAGFTEMLEKRKYD